jgi:hypothetical protein
MRTFAICLLLLVCGFTFTSAAAGVPRQVNYQGILTDSGGTPLSGAHTLTFTLYPDSVLSTPVLWTEYHANVGVVDGLFNVILGSQSEIPDSVFEVSEVWLGI